MLGHLEQESSENYLETIYQLTEILNRIRAIDIVKHLSLSRASVSRAISVLKEKQYVYIDDSGYIVLTEEGVKKAKHIWKIHKLLVKLLTCVCKVTEEIADVDACRIEHVLSDETIEKIENFVKENHKEANLNEDSDDFLAGSSHFPQNNKNTESFENYLEAIFELSQNSDHVRATHIASHLNLTRASVSRAISLLKEKECIEVSDKGFITLTESGKEIAQKVYHRHIDLSYFLENFVKVSREIALKDACRIEHLISEETITGLRSYMKK